LLLLNIETFDSKTLLIPIYGHVGLFDFESGLYDDRTIEWAEGGENGVGCVMISAWGKYLMMTNTIV